MFDMAIAAAPGFIASFAAAWIVTVLTSPPDDAITAQFDRVRAGPIEVPRGGLADEPAACRKQPHFVRNYLQGSSRHSPS